MHQIIFDTNISIITILIIYIHLFFTPIFILLEAIYNNSIAHYSLNIFFLFHQIFTQLSYAYPTHIYIHFNIIRIASRLVLYVLHIFN